MWVETPVHPLHQTAVRLPTELGPVVVTAEPAEDEPPGGAGAQLVVGGVGPPTLPRRLPEWVKWVCAGIVGPP
jgi:hypothetical protein